MNSESFSSGGALGGSETSKQDQELTAGCGENPPIEAKKEFSGAPAPFTLGDLIDSYQTHGASSYHKLRHHVRQNHVGTLRRLKAQHGHHPLTGILHLPAGTLISIAEFIR